MVTDIMRRYALTDEDREDYKAWLATPLAEKIDAVVDANFYHYDFWLVYNAKEHHYRRVMDSVDVRYFEIPLYKSTPHEPLETEGEVLHLINNTMDLVKDLID